MAIKIVSISSLYLFSGSVYKICIGGAIVVVIVW